MATTRFTQAEFSSYRSRVSGETPFPGGQVPPGAEKAKAALDNWHRRNVATIEGLQADLAATIAALETVLPTLDPSPVCQQVTEAIELAKAGGLQ